MKKLLIIPLLCLATDIIAQHTLRGRVLDSETEKPIGGIILSEKNGSAVTQTADNGNFVLNLSKETSVVIVSGGGYEIINYFADTSKQQVVDLLMVPKVKEIKEIQLSTGYQKIPKERSTGSFSTVSSELLNKEITTNVLDGIESFANGVMITRAENGNPQLMIRGLSTLNGPKNPLIILDDFPYEGDISNINPSSVQNITILKDAAASSIWGARAANGVIVINTRKGKYSQPIMVDFTANTTFSNKPDLNYIRQMSSADFIEVEKQFYNLGFYDSDITASHHPVLTPVVDLLAQQKDGIISAEEANRQIEQLKTFDVRDQYRKYMYMPGQKLQYALNISGGENNYSWITGLGYDRNLGNLGELFERKTFRLQNSFRFSPRLTGSAEVLYIETDDKSGRKPYGTVAISGNWNVPYLQFADHNGNALPVFSTYNQRFKESVASVGLLDWNYYPLNDWRHAFKTSKSNEVVLNSALQYKIANGLTTEIKYRYQKSGGLSETLFDKDSYYARNYINSYAQLQDDGNVQFIVPVGGILDRLNSSSVVNNLRIQSNYDYTAGIHSISGIAGGEIRSSNLTFEGNRYFGYNSNNQRTAMVNHTTQYPNFVTGGGDYVQSGQSMKEKKTRFMSLFANAAYTLNKKYILSGSIRTDASNLFGLHTNEQWNPFWSTGLAWKISSEKFYKISWLPELKLRASYGFNGNIDPSMVAVTTISYDSSPSIYTGTEMARIDQYYNPNLRWETSRTINLAIDFASKNNRLTGSLDIFSKKGTNLFGTAPLDYTTGITTLLWNAAGLRGKGADLELRGKIFTESALQWNTIVNFSHYRDEVTDYYVPNTFASNYVSPSGVSLPISGVIGLPAFSVYAYKWAGLDPDTGNPRGYLNGEISTDYTAITSSEKGIEDLEYFGSALPTSYGSFINSFSWNRFLLDVGLTYKLGYWFRRNSINYTNLMVSKNGHSDFSKRWQSPGDEQSTNVPSFSTAIDSSRDTFYLGSSALVEKGDHLRLQFINLSYEVHPNVLQRTIMKSLNVYCAVSNLGILWRANKQNLDPDFSWGNNTLKPVTTYTLGVRAKF